MGAAESSEKEPQILQIFTDQERRNVHYLYLHITGNQKTLTEPFLKKFLPQWLDEKLKDAIFPAICNCQPNKGRSIAGKNVSEAQLGGFLAEALKGTYSEKADIVCLFSGENNQQVRQYELYQTLYSVVQSYLVISKRDAAHKTWRTMVCDEDISRLCVHLLGLKESHISEKDDRLKTIDEVELWISKCPLFLKFFDRVFSEVFFPGETFTREMQSLMPNVTNVDWNKTHTILDELSISYINYHLPSVHQSEWRLLYSNSLHGDSFSQLVRFISGKGPNVLLVQDKSGHMFGAYVTESWEMKPNFYGTPECFIFTIKPHFDIYTTTGYNENFMYFNQGQETLPNGLGLGGQLNYFGLWIDYTFNSGQSKAVPKCTTYGSPQLSESPEFVVDSIEVWGVGPEKKTDSDDEDEYSKKSILDKDPGAKAILEMVGKKQHSDGLRDLAEDEAPLTEEMKRKMNTIPKLL